MKQIASAYTYNKTTGVIVLTGVNIDRDQLLLIVNTTRNVTYYNFADSTTTLLAFTQGVNTSVTLATSIISASSAHTNADALTIYYDDQVAGSGIVTANVGLNELPYIKVNINVANASEALVSNVYLRRIGEYSYESITYKGGEDEAYLRVYLDNGDESTQRQWRLYSYGAFAGVQGLVALAFPQNAGSYNGNALPPQTGWLLPAGITGTLTISYEQPSIQPISGTVTATDLGVKADAVATTDTGTFSVIALIKRGLQNWTSLLAKIPTLVSGRIPIDGSAVTQPISGTVNVGLNQLPYIKANIAITKTGYSSLNTNVFLRRISEYKYESIRYQGGEDEAYVQIELKQAGTNQLVWKASYLGGYADWAGEFAQAIPQNKGNDTGDAFPPTTWTPSTGFTGTTTVSYEQPSTQPVTGPLTNAELRATAVPTEVYTGGSAVGSSNALTIKTTNAYGSNQPTVVIGYNQTGAGVLQPSDTSGFPIRPSSSATFPVTGTFWQATQPVSGTVTANTGLTQPLTNAELRASSFNVSVYQPSSFSRVGVNLVDASGTGNYGTSGSALKVADTLTTTPAVTTFTSITSATLIASNTSRRMLTIQNTGAGILYVLFGTGVASATNFSLQMNSGDFYECDYYNGQVNAIFATAGTAYVTSLT